jgi:hypothetical protein
MVDDADRYTIAVDFDGVIHSYTTPWISGAHIPDEPVPGAIDWLRRMSRHFNIVIHTTRASTVEGEHAVYQWLARYGISPDNVTDQKVPALIYIDDRGYRFEGDNFPTRHAMMMARPWNKKGTPNGPPN